MKMMLAACARAGTGISYADRERALDEAVSHAVRVARLSFPARVLPEPTVRRFEGAVLIVWSDEPDDWSLAYASNGPAAIDGVGYCDAAYRASDAARAEDLLGYSVHLGGCFNLFRVSDHRIEAVTDATKSNSVYVGESDRLFVLASRALLAHLVASGRDEPEFDLEALASMPSKGYIVGSGTPFPRVKTLGVAEHISFAPDEQRRTSAVPTARSLHETNDWDSIVASTAESLVAAFDPLSGGNVHLALTGGRDSRVIAAALAYHGGIGVTTHTMGDHRDPDVILAAEIAELSGWSHSIKPPSRSSEPGAVLVAEEPLERIVRVLDVHDAMNSAWDDIEDYGDFVPLPIMSGVGGEILRGGLVLTSHTAMSVELARRELIAATGAGKFLNVAPTASVERYLEIADQDPHRALDDFYYHERNGRWVASRRMGARFRRRVVDPLLDNRFIRETRRIDPSARWSELLAFEIVERLHPRIRDLRMEGSRWRFERGEPSPAHREGWSARGALVRDSSVAAFNWKNLTEPRMRARVDSLILDAIGSGPASELLDRSQVEQFLRTDSRYPGLRWHLATVSVMLSTPWWGTARSARRESIVLSAEARPERPDELVSTNSTTVDRSPAVSVVVPMHNAEKHVSETLESLASQTLLDIQVIVVDDGSTDRSSAIVDSFVARDSRFSRVVGPGVGSAGAARNEGMRHALGGYVAFLDADDVFAPTMLEKLYAKAVAEDADIVLTGFQSLDNRTGEQVPQRWALRTEYLPKETPFAPSEIADHLFYITNPANWNKLFRRDFIESAGLRFQELRRANDAYFTYIALTNANRITYVPEHLVLYRVGNSSSLQGSVDESPLEFVKALEHIHQAIGRAGWGKRYERAFANLVATTTLGALSRARSAHAFERIYATARENLFPRFGLAGASPKFFLNQSLSARVQEVLDSSASQWLFTRLNTSPVGAPMEVASDEAPEATGLVTSGEFSESGAIAIRPDVSVIVPVYNSAAWLHECLLSILGQSGASMEVICVNDGSTDDSLRILNEYALIDSRVVIVNQQNGGLSTARNSGLDVARGRYVCMIDSDDYWRVDQLSELIARADGESLDVLLFDAVSLFEPGVSETTRAAYEGYYRRARSYSQVTAGVELISRMREDRVYRASACLYLVRADYLAQSRIRFIPGILHEDNPFTFSVLVGAGRAAHENRAFYARRVRPGSIMTDVAEERSLRGYFASYVAMMRSLVGHTLSPGSAENVARVVHDIYSAALKRFVRLPAEVGERLLVGEGTAEAHVAYLTMRAERSNLSLIAKLRGAK